MKLPLILTCSFAALATVSSAEDTLDAGLMRMPAVSEKQIAFVYAGDIWIAPKEGGTAIRLSSPRGEESWPRFSPEGRELAFTGNYEGNEDIYIMPVSGGEPRRVTYHGGGDRVVGWWPDGKSIIFASRRDSFSDRVGQFFKINAQGGPAQRLPIPYGEYGSVSPDGKTFAYTMTDTDRASWKRYRGGMAPDVWLFHLDTGAAENITDNPACDSQPMWSRDGKLYFLSDRDEKKRANLWQYDSSKKELRQITKFTDFDVRYPSIGPKEIVFENGGQLHLLDLATEKTHVVKVEVVTDKATLRPRLENVSTRVAHASLSPTGKRVLFEARGDIFSAPAENGITRNLTESQGVAERYPAWSPDGKWIAYFSDRSGEYELTLLPADGKGKEQQVTTLGAGWRYSPTWSPDSKKLVFIDNAMRIWLHDLDTKQTSQIDKQKWMYHGDLERFSVSWSSDSRWIAYAGDTDAQLSAIVLYDTKDGKRHQVTAAYYDDDMPVFDPAGNYLFYRSKRIFQPHYSDFDNSWAYVNSHSLICVTLRKDMPSPLAPKNDEEPYKKDEPKKEEKKEDKKDTPPKSTDPAKKPEDSKKSEASSIAGKWQGTVNGSPRGPRQFTLVLEVAPDGAVSGTFTVADQTGPVTGRYDVSKKELTLTGKTGDGPELTFRGTVSGETFNATSQVQGVELTLTATRETAIKPVDPRVTDTKPEDKKPEDKKPDAPKPKEVKIDLDGFEGRAVVIPVGSGSIDQLGALPGKVLFRWPPRKGSNNNTAPLSMWDIEARAEKSVVDNLNGYEISADGRKMLIARGGQWSIAAAGENAGAGKGVTVSLELTVDPVVEWQQMFVDAWRIERDYFYDPHLHMVPWQQMRERYGQMVKSCLTRADVNYVLGELLGELNSSHTYRSGGDLDGGPSRSVGYLGCDFELKDGAYRITRILEVAPWDTGVRSPLREPGISVKEGEYLLAVNGHRLDPAQEPYAAFQGLADKAVLLTLNDKPSMEGSREILVKTIGTESALRHYAWVESNRRRVDEATGGRCGYVYVKNTGVDGQTELYRQWRAQTYKDGIIVDERWNAGGQIPDRFIELLRRPSTNFWGVRDGKDWSTPFVPSPAVRVMLANRWSGSGGDCFPWLFQQNKLGPVIGTRTWGGLIGMTGCPPLVDGGSVTVPTFSIYDKDGKWIIEGHGVDPDIPVVDDPAILAKGTDPQLERAITEIKAGLEKNPPKRPARPAYNDRTK
jgi:tricorn protease-like protein/C-terminal processing protease CtpA/Prc